MGGVAIQTDLNTEHPNMRGKPGDITTWAALYDPMISVGVDPAALTAAQVLGVKIDTRHIPTEGVIKARLRFAARLCHPDKVRHKFSPEDQDSATRATRVFSAAADVALNVLIPEALFEAGRRTRKAPKLNAWQEPSLDLHAWLQTGFCTGTPRFKKADGQRRPVVFATWWSNLQRVEFNQAIFT